jgi:glucosamine--fructose-6-phosphate aminotransferase (isomerizing)
VPLNLEAVRGPYLDDLLHQPEALAATLNALRETDVFARIAQSCPVQKFARIVLTGMGGSLHVLHPLAIELAAHARTPLMLETSELIHFYPNLLAPTTLVIAVSQSGQSAETLRLLDLNADLNAGATIIGITNTPASPLGLRSHFPILTAAGSEHSVSCKTYVSTLLALSALAAALTGSNIPARLRDLEPAASAVESWLRNWQSHAEEFAGLLANTRDIFLVGRGPSLAAANAGALILKESTRTHAEGMSSAAFRHGPFEILEPGIFIGIFAGNATARPLNQRLLADIEPTGATAVLFSSDSPHAACRLPQVPEPLLPIAEILPAQMLTLAVAALRNHQPGRFRWSGKITVVE